MGRDSAFAGPFRSAALPLLVLLLLIAACEADVPLDDVSLPVSPGTSAAQPRASLRTSKQFDFSALVRQVHFAFRAAGNGWEGKHATYAVRADDMSFDVAPRHLVRRAQADGEDDVVAEGAAATFATSTIERDAAPLSGSKSRAALDDDGTLAIDRGAVLERLENGESGVEQSWSFATRPEGSGALTVRVRVSGQAFVGETEHGLHFADAATGLGVRYGHATWIDASGARTAVPVVRAAGGVEVSVPAEVVDASTYPALLDPTVSPEFGMDNPVTSPVGVAQETPKIAFDGVNYLVVWTDPRNGSDFDIYGARVTQAGAVLDTLGIGISSATGAQRDPAVGYDGTNYFVVWRDVRSGTNNDIYGSRVTKGGTVLDASGIAISTAVNDQFAPAVKFGGGTYLVAWRDNRTSASGDIYASRVTVNGSVTDSSGILISNASSTQDTPVIAYDGTNFLVAWADYRSGSSFDVYAARLDVGGAMPTVLDGAGILVSAATRDQKAPAVAFDGTNYMLVWDDTRVAVANADIYAARLGTNGVVLDAAGIAVSTSGNNQATPAIAFDGVRYMAVWKDNRNSLTDSDIYGARIAMDGTVQEALGIPISIPLTDQQSPAIAFDGTNYLTVWQDYRNASPDIYGARVSTAGGVADPGGILVATSANDQLAPAVAYDGTNYLVTWQDFRAGTSFDIYGTRVSGSGTVLDPTGIPITTAAKGQFVPAVAYCGNNYLVVWQDQRNAVDEIYGSRVSTAGAVVDPSGIAIATGGTKTRPAVAHDGTNCLVVYEYSGSIYGTRVTAAGTVVDAGGFYINSGYNPAIAFGGTRYLVVLESSADIYATTVNTNGTLSTNCYPTFVGNTQYAPAVAFNGTNFFVTWQDLRSNVAYDIYGTRVTTSCSVTDSNGIAISTAADAQTSPTVTWDGTDFVVVWEDRRTGVGLDLFSTRVTPAAVVQSPGGIPISEDLTINELLPVLASDGAGHSLVAYQRFDPAAPYKAQRVRGRMLDGLAQGGAPCTLPSDCANNFCIDGYCCDTACNGTCQACSTAKKGSGVNGVCGPIQSGADPDNECSDQGAMSCGTDGTCNGGSACRLYVAGTSCGATICDNNLVKGQICNGAGTCALDMNGTNCAPFVCAGGACTTTCVNDNGCVSPNFCNTNTSTCQPPLPQGSQCASPSQCQSGQCIDGVCCASACGGTCMACSAAKKGAGADGVCGPIVAMTDPDNECAFQAPATCAQTGLCNGGGACALHPAGTQCAAQTCNGSTQTSPSTCNGTGTCVAGSSTGCVPGYVCVGPACATSCLDDSACAAGFHCDLSFNGCIPDGSSGAGGGSSTSSSSSGSSSNSSGAGGSGVGGSGAGGSGANGGGSGTCTPGAQVSCACPGGVEGVQVCNADGTGFDPCSCAPAGGTPPAEEDGGCGCRLPGGSEGQGQAGLLGLLLAAALVWRRRNAT